jgi:hypothetical protein
MFVCQLNGERSTNVRLETMSICRLSSAVAHRLTITSRLSVCSSMSCAAPSRRTRENNANGRHLVRSFVRSFSSIAPNRRATTSLLVSIVVDVSTRQSMNELAIRHWDVSHCVAQRERRVDSGAILRRPAHSCLMRQLGARQGQRTFDTRTVSLVGMIYLCNFSCSSSSSSICTRRSLRASVQQRSSFSSVLEETGPLVVAAETTPTGFDRARISPVAPWCLIDARLCFCSILVDIFIRIGVVVRL